MAIPVRPRPVVSYDDAGEFDTAFEPLIGPALNRFRRRLRAVPDPLSTTEREILLRAARRALLETVRPKANRLLLLELHAARMSGRLTRATSEQRWLEFLEHAAEPGFWSELDVDYPAFAPRLDRVIRNRCTALLTLARRIAADRDRLTDLLGTRPGELVEIGTDAGDSHRGGRTVALLRFEAGRVVYKPRALDVDVALATTVDTLLAHVPREERIAVPRVLLGGEYGWAEYVEHRYCADAAERSRFYRGLGEWMCVVQLLGGTDLHSENVIACGPVPWVVDCETLFSPEPRVGASGLGDAFDTAAASVRRTVLRTGLLPMRLGQLALQGVDMSAVGALPDQQPRVPVPVITGAGTDLARLTMEPADVAGSANLPAPDADPLAHQDDIVHGYRDLRARLDGRDAAGRLRPMLDVFAGCELRVVLRPTQVYVEIARMLWHPASLHEEGPAVERARDVLIRQAKALHGAPDTPEVVGAEVADLLDGDIPFFGVRPERGRMTGPRGTEWGDPAHLIDESLDRWRAGDPEFEEVMIRSSLLGVYRDRSAMPEGERHREVRVRHDEREERRRALAAEAARDLCARAVVGADGTATWIGPVYTDSGFNVRPFAADLYSGQAGVALALRAYLTESRAGRVPIVDGLPALTEGAIRALAAMEDAVPTARIGAFDGIGAAVRTWLALHTASGRPTDLDRAIRHAERAPGLLAEDTILDLAGGAAGSIVPMLALADRTGDRRWRDVAESAAELLGRRAVVEEDSLGRRTARWPTVLFPDGIGGFAHGAAGIAWALTRLGLAASRPKWFELADLAWAFQEALYDPKVRGWLDGRQRDEVLFLDSWCHGSTGIGLAGWDLYRRTGAPEQLDRALRAAAATWRTGFGWDYTLCHGDLGSWELLDTLLRGAPEQLRSHLRNAPTRERLDALLLTGLETYGPHTPSTRHTTTASLLPGSAGALHQLLRMHPTSADRPSSLLLLDEL
ncbi:LanM family lanthionine synthetase [Embleya scabrispora]|uniref:LanM family lanthionine synthetase n=1 Tax=Embleya scabrispora TaxID=159449 RepID=A0A1T3NRS5_9ACTN|nr:type 2 lanthipeptide synthetase LanM family protein [Embleya scabrispora]OPC79410.1 LanM family lanthionine synthetase [Embleya scabrispora]